MAPNPIYEMGIGCKGTCSRYSTVQRYREGNKQCTSCEMFIKWSGLRCPCCNRILRAKGKYGRSKRGREPMMEKEIIVEIG